MVNIVLLEEVALVDLLVDFMALEIQHQIVLELRPELEGGRFKVETKMAHLLFLDAGSNHIQLEAFSLHFLELFMFCELLVQVPLEGPSGEAQRDIADLFDLEHLLGELVAPLGARDPQALEELVLDAVFLLQGFSLLPLAFLVFITRLVGYGDVDVLGLIHVFAVQAKGVPLAQQQLRQLQAVLWWQLRNMVQAG